MKATCCCRRSPSNPSSGRSLLTGARTACIALMMIGASYAARADLSPGDIAIIGYQGDNPDQFAFVTFVSIPQGTVIRFTDCGWLADNSGFRTSEGGIQWTAGQDYACGTVISRSAPFDSGEWSVNNDGFSSNGFGLSTDGDQILAFQGAVSSPSFIYGLNYNDTGWSDATNSNSSALPPGLTNGTTAVDVGTPTEFDNGYYNGTTSDTRANLLASIGDKTTWALSDTRFSDFPSWTFTVSDCGGAPQGACCLSDNSCEVLTQSDCEGRSGSYQGDSSTCDGNPCAPPTGACCFEDGSCTETLPGDCTGAYQGDGTTCDPNVCPQPPATGACCAGDGSCAIATSDDCTAGDGRYLGDDTLCDPNPCSLVNGACCFGNGACLQTDDSNCADFGGEFQGADTTCDPNPCDRPTNLGFFLAELLINSPGADDGLESIEIQGPPNTSLKGYWLIVIDGDLSPGGTVDQKVDLSAYSTGANGLLLIRDGDTVIYPGPDADTNVVTYNFTPDIENGSDSIILGYGTFRFNVEDDLDLDNDGTLDSDILGFTSIDAVSYVDGDVDGYEYADDFGGTALGDLGTFTPDALYRVLDCDSALPLRWAGGDVFGDSTTGFQWDTTTPEVFGWGDLDPDKIHMNLGVINTHARCGACCIGNNCSVGYAVDCTASGGVYQGDDTGCDPNPCEEPIKTGACCAADGSCTVKTSNDCATGGGQYQGDDTTCDPNECPQPPKTGACCAADGSCTVVTADECENSGGDYQGDTTSCEPNLCPQPFGACCFGNGVCLTNSSVDCSALGGVYQGNSTTCDPNPCDQQNNLGFFIAETLFNPPGSDNGLESLEIMGPANTSLDGYWLIVIEGDTSSAGVVDQKIDLSGYSTGANGLLLIRDGNTVITPAPDSDTNVVVRDFTPDIENGANTFVLGYGTFRFKVGDDLDTDNDGTLDATFTGFTAVDSVSYQDGDAGGLEYADDLGGTALGDLGSFTPDALYRIMDCNRVTPLRWAGGDVLGDATNGFTWDTPGGDIFGFIDNIPEFTGPDLGHINVIDADCTGACCLSDGSCSIMTESDCIGDGGIYQGAETTCDPNPCTPPDPCEGVVLGDSNGDGTVDFNDIDCFVSALIGIDQWLVCGTTLTSEQFECANDTDQSGTVDFNDIDAFIECLINGGC